MLLFWGALGFKEAHLKLLVLEVRGKGSTMGAAGSESLREALNLPPHVLCICFSPFFSKPHDWNTNYFCDAETLRHVR